jgi:phosphotransferase system HPr (HPr) family protein
MTSMPERSVEIPVNRKEALHLRPMHALAERAVGFKAKLIVERGGKRADAKSIIEMMMLAPETGPLMLHADGDDAEQAIEELSELLNRVLNEA